MSKQTLSYQKIRRKIKVNDLTNMLHNHCVDPDTHPMKSTQLKAAEMLLKRALPELRSVEHTGKIDSKIEVSITRED